MLKRPTSDDTEEDLLKFQEKFLKDPPKASASLIKHQGKRHLNDQQHSQDADKDIVQMEGLPSEAPKSENLPPVKKSRFHQERGSRSTAAKDDDDPEEKLDKHDKHVTVILEKIIERDNLSMKTHFQQHAIHGFPVALHRGTETKASTKPGKKKSMFAQQFAKSKASDFGLTGEDLREHCEKDENKREGMEISPGNDGLPSVEGIEGETLHSGDAKQIHDENLSTLSGMTEEDILSEQRKLLETLDPKLVEFLKTKRTKGSGDAPMSKMSAAVSDQKPVMKEPDRDMEVTIDPKDLPVKPNKEWVHMDKLELDKLTWMKDLPLPSADNNKTGQQARFDFHGNLMAADADIPVNVGLHHHGDEPERAGYSLEELFQLTRSANTQQRVISLNTLASIIQKAKQHCFDDLTQGPIFPSLLDAGLLFILRWALDDSIDLVIVAALNCLCAVLVNPADQLGLDRVFHWYRGQEMPAQSPKTLEDAHDRLEEGEEPTPETDPEVVKRDAVLGLVTKMTFLPRLRYILEVCRPQAPTVLDVLSIMTRIAQHSQNMAYEVLHCPRLMETIFQEFLPTAWEPQDPDKPLSFIHGFPVSGAMRLMRVIAQAGKNMAAILESKHSITNRILRYIAVKPCDLQLPTAETYQLQVESCRAWRVLIQYGVGVEHYLNLYQTLMENLQNMQPTVMMENPRMQCRNKAIVGLLEAVVNLAASNQNLKANFRQRDDETKMDTAEIAPPLVNWSHVTGLLQPITICMKNSLQEIREKYQQKKMDLCFATSCLNFVASFFYKLHKQADVNAMESLQQAEDIITDVILPLWKGFGFQVIIRSLSTYSNVISQTDSSRREVSPSLPELGCCAVDLKQLPVLSQNTPYGFVTAVLRLIHSLCVVHKGVIDKVIERVIEDPDILSYLKKVIQYRKSGWLLTNYFTKFENQLVFYLIKLVSLKPVGNMALYHGSALCMIARLQHGDEYIAHDLLSTVLFNPLFIPIDWEKEASMSMAEMTLIESSPMRSATQENIQSSGSRLQHDAYTHLMSVRATYIGAFGQMEKAVMQSRSRCLQCPLQTETFFTPSLEESLLPKDWMYLPLIDLYNRANALEADGHTVDSLNPAQVTMVTNVLRWIYILVNFRRDIIADISITMQISRIMCVFLTGNDLFLEKSVQSYLAFLLGEYCHPRFLDQMDFEQPIAGISSFYDLYILLLKQYGAVSFGDPLFAGYVLFPLQQRHHASLRKAVWGEHISSVRALKIPIRVLPIPIERYLVPEEDNVELIRLYFQALFSQCVRPAWSPVLYLVGVHHVNRFIYTQDGKHRKLKQMMLQHAAACSQELLKRHILYYKNVNVQAEYGMEFYSDLPQIRQTLLDSVKVRDIS